MTARNDTTQRTPGLWAIDRIGATTIWGNNGEGLIADCVEFKGFANAQVLPYAQRRANAAFIVEACNAYDTLRAQNAALAKALSDVLTTGDLLSSGRPSVPAYLAAIERARAALQQSDPSA